jgi:hypothetical protein
VWLNLGDSYAANGSRGNNNGSGASTMGWPDQRPETLNKAVGLRLPPVDHGLKPKDLVGIPWRVAFALQADGWYLRSDIIWSKPNPMPESVTDRPTKSHEYLFLLAKSPRYYFDADAVREDYLTPRDTKASMMFGSPNGKNTTTDQAHSATPGKRFEFAAGRNIRTVWTVATQPYPGAHFAVFPEKLIEPCILAGTSEKGVCPECGAPWRRVTERTVTGVRHVSPKDSNPNRNDGPDEPTSRLHTQYFDDQRRTLSWIPSCGCVDWKKKDDMPGGGMVEAVVLDPFGGSGTTARVANRLSRRAILIDLNPEYLKQQMDRNRDIPLGLGAA